MWTIIHNNNLKNYELKYGLFTKYPEREYILHTNENFHILPRYFSINFPDDNLITHHDTNFNPITFNEDEIQFTGNLREYQEPIVKSFIDKYNQDGFVNGILNARPGSGKTLISVYLFCKLKKKTLIVVDNEKLKSQFIETIIKFTNLTEDDIGTIQGSKFDTDKPITITLVQTLLSKIKRDLKSYYPKIRDCGFDLVIYDEVHKTSSGPKYALSTLFVNTKNIIGLSATPYVRDIHKLLLFNTMGDIIHTEKEYECIPKIFYMRYDSKIDHKKKYRANFIKDYIKLQAFYNSIIADNENYLFTIFRIVKKCLDNDHKIIVMVSTVKQIEKIIEKLNMLGIPAKALYSKQTEIDKEKDNILVATYRYASAGFDYQGLSALILASPYKGQISLIQTIGRILRSLAGKKDPVVFDLMDIQFPNLFEKNIQAKNKIFDAEFGKCETQIINLKT